MICQSGSILAHKGGFIAQRILLYLPPRNHLAHNASRPCRTVFAAAQRPEGAFGVRQLAAAFINGPICPFFKDSIKAAAWKLSQNRSMERAFSPYLFYCFIPGAPAPGWYEAAPSALNPMQSHTFESAKGASHSSLGQRPRKESKQ
jgi:hypothetical protein